MMVWLLLKSAALIFGFSALSFGILKIFERILPRQFDRELHDLALGSLLLVPILFLVACLPEYLDVSSALSEVQSTSISAHEFVAAPVVVQAWEQTAANLSFPAIIGSIVFLIWALGALISVGRLYTDYTLIRKLRREATFLKVPYDMQLSRVIPVMSSSAVISPMLVGYLHPIILLPESFKFNASAKSILEHEIAHADRKDNWVMLFIRMIGCAFWWNFPAYKVQYILFCARERICDRRAVGVTGDPHALALGLVDIASHMKGVNHTPLSVMAHSQSLRQRVDLLLRDDVLHRPKSFCPSWLIISVLGALCITFSPRLGIVEAKITPTAYAQTLSPEQSKLSRALYQAVQFKRAGTVNDLLLKGANPNLSADGNPPPLFAAARAGRSDLVELLLVYGADPNVRFVGDGTPLIAAVFSGDENTVDSLLRAGAAPNAYVILDETALVTASRKGRFSIAKKLVEAGADVSLTVKAHDGDKGGPYRSPLSEAERNGHERIAAWLLAKGARHAPPEKT